MLSLIIILSSSVFAAEPDTLRLDRNVVPTFESIRLHLDPEKKDYEGEVEINLDVRVPTRAFRLHAQDLDIQRVELTRDGHVLPARWSTGPDGLMRIAAGQPLSTGPCILIIRFANDIPDKGFGLFRVDEEGQSYLSTQFEMTYARQAFPCWDEPGFKNPFQVTITLPSAFSAFSNTPVEKTTLSGQKKTVVFEKTPPLSVYAVAFVAGPFETVPIMGMSVPGNVIVTAGNARLAGETARVTPAILGALEKRFTAYPFRKLDLVAVPGQWGAMENPGLVIFDQNILLMDPAASTLDSRHNCSWVIAHELAHMWFGDLVTMSWWNETWLNESFATWIGIDIMDEVFPLYRSFVWDIQGTQRAMTTDALPSTRPIRRDIRADDDPMQVFDELSYQKGGAVLGMVESWAGKENFHRGIIDYLGKFRWKNAESKELWESLSLCTGGKVDSMTASFTEQPGIPLVRAELLPHAKLRLSQSRFLNCGFEATPQLWQIPMVINYGDGKHRHQSKHVLKKGVEIISLDCATRPEWIDLNADERGYYRWLVQDSIFQTLAERFCELMNVRERIGFLGNASALLDGGFLRGDAYLRILRAFAADTIPEVLQMVLSGLGKLNDGLRDPGTDASFAHYVRSILRPALQRIATTKRKNEGETVGLLRSGLISVLAVQGRDQEIICLCDSLKTEYFEDPAALDPELVDAVLSVAALHGDDTLFGRFVSGYESAQTPADKSRFLWLLGIFKDRGLLKRGLDYALTGPVAPGDFLSVPFAAAGFIENRAYLLDWTIQNFKAIAAKSSPEILDNLAPRLVRICSDTLLTKARKFFSDPVRKRQMMEINLNKAEERIITLMRVREKEGLSIAEYLKQY
jgi:alanyl aminopeptidase